MIRIIVLFTSIICLYLPCSAQKEDKQLQQKLEVLFKDFHGQAGVYVRHLKKGTTAAINADTIFPTASMIKVPITIGLMDRIERGEIAYDSLLTYKDSLLYEGEDILGSFKNGEKIALGKVMMLMITTSDNTASLWCQSLAGKGPAINAILEKNGLKDTRVNSRTPGREANRTKYGWGQTTPREMAELVAKVREGKIISPGASERIYRNLTRIYWDDVALSQIPPYIQAASKQGMVTQSKSEVVLVNAPHGDYVFCVITKNQQDERWESDNEGYVLLRNVSKLLWNYFEPDSKWKPADGADKFHE